MPRVLHTIRRLPLVLAVLLLSVQIIAWLYGGHVVSSAAEPGEVIYPLLVLSYNASWILSIVWILMGVGLLATRIKWLGYILLVGMPLLFCGICYLVLPISLRHIDTVRVENRVDQLASVDEFDFDLGRVTLILYVCDDSGIHCRPEYVSDVTTLQLSGAHLVHDVTTNQLYLERANNVIYVHDDIASPTPTPLPVDNLAPITPQNADRLVLIAHSARAPARNPFWPGWGETLAIPSGYYDSGGIWFYPSKALNQAPRWWQPEGFNALHLAFSADGSLVVAASYGYISVWDVHAATRLVNWAIPGGKLPRSLAFHPGNRWIAYSSSTYLENGDLEVVVDLLDVQQLRSKRLFDRVEREDVNGLAYSPDGRLLAVAGSQLSLWETESGTERVFQTFPYQVDSSRFPARKAETVVFSPDDALVASVNDDGSVYVWNVQTGQQHLVPRWKSGEWSPSIAAVAFSPEGKLLAGAEPWGSLYFWDLSTSELVFSTPKCAGDISGILFNPAGTLLATTSEEGIVCVWGIAQQ
jgi:hypothetical protein